MFVHVDSAHYEIEGGKRRSEKDDTITVSSVWILSIHILFSSIHFIRNGIMTKVITLCTNGFNKSAAM